MQERVPQYPGAHFKDTRIPTRAPAPSTPSTEHQYTSTSSSVLHPQPVAELEVGGSPSKHCLRRPRSGRPLLRYRLSFNCPQIFTSCLCQGLPGPQFS